MGCTSSKQFRRGRLEERRAYWRSYSLPFPQPYKRSSTGGSSEHVVHLTSSTLGSICLDRVEELDGLVKEPVEGYEDHESMKKTLNDERPKWSEEGLRKLRTPAVTPPDEPEMINTWELMEGLEEDVTPIRRRSGRSTMERSFSFPASMPEFGDERKEASELEKGFKEQDKEEKNEPAEKTSLVKLRIHAFQEKINARRAANAAQVAAFAVQAVKQPPSGEGKVVLYFTSLRGVRKTYEDCCEVLIILRGYGVRIDERDVSMHGGFKEELYDILGVVSGGVKLPRVFADRRYLGGADEIRLMHESGALLEALEGCAAPISVKGIVAACVGCGDVRFVPCKVCSGSCKVFVEEDAKAEEQGEEGGNVGFRRCKECNENGLVRCPICCAA